MSQNTGFTPELTLPEDSQFGFSYEYGVDIEIDGQWQPIRFISDVVPSVEPVTQPGQTYEDKGSPHDIKVSETWTLGFYVQEHHTATGLLPELAAILARTSPEAIGNEATAPFRWYDKPASGRAPMDEVAFSGRGSIKAERAQTGADGALAGWNVTVTGQGRRLAIPNPMNAEA